MNKSSGLYNTNTSINWKAHILQCNTKGNEPLVRVPASLVVSLHVLDWVCIFCVSCLLCLYVFTARCTTVHSAVLWSHDVCPSVTLMDHDHIGSKSWKLIPWSISPTSTLFVAQRTYTYSQGNVEKFWGKCSFNTYVDNVRLNWLNRESVDLRWRCGCLFIYFCRRIARSSLRLHSFLVLFW